MRRPLIVAATVGSLAVAACGSQSNHSQDGGSPTGVHLEATSVEMAPASTQVNFDDLAQGNRQLGYHLAQQIRTDDGNLVYSPASLAVAFAMLREGADGVTADEIDKVIGLPADRQAAYNALLHEMGDIGPGDVLDTNDGIFLADGFDVETPFLEALKRWYGAGVERTSFPDPGIDEVNSWVDARTHGRIPQLLDYLDPLTVMVLVNTIYLNAKWQIPFDAALTAPAPFRTAGDDSVTPQTMHLTAELEYAEGPGWQAIRLPYRGGETSMWVLLPRDGDPRDLLAPETLTAAADAFDPGQVEVRLPRWDTGAKAQLIPVLESLGMTHTFEGAGNFRSLTSARDFGISQVVQQANVTVGEKGTVAAAATAIVGRAESAPPTPEQRFTADHPFAFAVMHDTTGVPLFEGVVNDPS